MKQITTIFICFLAITFIFSNTVYAANTSNESGNQLSLKGAPSLLMPESGDVMPGVNIQFAARFIDDLPINFTAEAGPYFSSDSIAIEGIGKTSFSKIAVPLLFGANYTFVIPDSRFTPYVGANLGPVFTRVKLSSPLLDGLNVPKSGSSTSFGMFFTPGVSFELARNFDLSFEPRLGAISSAFVFSPQLGLRYVF